MKWIWFVFVLWMAGCGRKAESPLAPLINPDYQLVLVDSRWPERPFLIDLPLTNREGIRSFEQYLTGGKVTTDADGNPDIGVVSGMVIQGAASPPHGWSFYLNPSTVQFADMTAEVCDGTFSYVEENLQGWMLEVKAYCPWGTRSLIQSIKKGGVLLYQRAS